MSTTAGSKYASPYGKEVAPVYPEYCTIAGARRLKKQLENWYRDRNLPVPKFKVVKLKGALHTCQLYGVRSDMLDGLLK